MSVRRRDVLGVMLALFPARLAAQGLPAAKIHRIGWLGSAQTDSVWQPFVEGLLERGWIEGKNIAFERLYSSGRNDRLPELAAQLVRLKPDVIVSHATGTLTDKDEG